jgi:hypothetical protein
MATIRVGKEDLSIPAGKTLHVRCRVPPTFDTSNPVVLYEPAEGSTPLEQLSVGEGILEINNSRWPLVNVPVSNHTKHEVILPKRTQLGSIQHVAKVIETDKTETQQVEKPQGITVRAEVHNVTTCETPPTEPWRPPVDLSHLDLEQQRMVEEMLREESAAFAHDGEDIGCIPSLQMSIKLKDDFPFQKSYASIPKPLYKEVKEYIQDLIVKGWIVKSHSPYAAPIVCVRKKDGSLHLCILSTIEGLCNSVQ